MKNKEYCGWCDQKGHLDMCPNNPKNQTNIRIREEFGQSFSNVGWIPENKERIINFMLSKIAELLKSQRKEILNALRYVVAEDEDGYDTLEEIIKVAGIDK